MEGRERAGSAEPLLPFVDGSARRSRFSVRPKAAPTLAPVPRLLAGAAEVDLTPPPGMPKAGYSSNANLGNGFRTRLRARVVHLRAGTVSLAIVQCDLLGGSSVVQHLVAQAVADRTDIPLAGIWIGATHTHAGPGQFLGTDFYNRWASNKAGFDAAWTQFLVDRISTAVVEAHATRGPARLAVGSTDVWGLTRNRSLGPHVQNESVTDKRTEAQRKWVSINPQLHLVRVDAEAADGGLSPLAAAVVFSVHGTGISQHAHEYNADVWAYLVGELGDRIERAHGTRPVVGAMEGTHADVAPALRPGLAGHREAQRIGRGVGAEAAELYERLEGALRADVTLAAGLREVDLGRDRSIDGIELPNRPAVGAALVAGATENETPFVHRVPPFRPGMPKRRDRGPHGGKWIIGSRWGQALVLPISSFPRVLAVQALRLGDALLVGLPFEITVESGRRIEAAVVAGVAGHGVASVIVSSVANEYWGYCTTPEEYRRQHYEGGHTLYGPRTQPFLAAHAARLAGETVRTGQVSQALPERRWDLASRRYLVASESSSAPRRVLEPARFSDPTAATDGHWELQWTDGPPGSLRWHEPLVRVESADGHGDWQPAMHDRRPVDDQGWELEVTHLGPGPDGAHVYRTRWYEPVLRAGRRHRFVLVANGARPEIASDPFD
ncbi:MAG: alkaline ceramidase [Acidimicrobiales bacterium]|nr:alkaline ceramidase [Acidimicrobiales bacterium]